MAMDFGFGRNVNKAYKKMLKSGRERRKRREAEIQAGRAHEIGLERLRQKGGLYQTALRGRFGLAERGMAEKGAGERAQLQYGPESVAAKRLRMEKQNIGVKLGIEARKVIGAGRKVVNTPIMAEGGFPTDATRPGVMDLGTGRITPGYETKSRGATRSVAPFNLQDYLEKKRPKRHEFESSR